MSPHDRQNKFYKLIQDRPDLQSQIINEAVELGMKLRLDPNYGSQITSSTIDGQTFSAQPGQTNQQRHDELMMLVDRIKAQSPISKTVTPYF